MVKASCHANSGETYAYSGQYNLIKASRTANIKCLDSTTSNMKPTIMSEVLATDKACVKL